MLYLPKISLLTAVYLILLSLSTQALAFDQNDPKRFNIELEIGPVWQAKNDVRIPGNSGTEFSFSDLAGSGPYAYGRLTFDWDFFKNHGFRFVAAPLRFEGTGNFEKPVLFAGSTFNANIATKGKYKFDTYRFSYRYLFLNTEAWQLKVGATILLRDAEIELEQNGLKASDDNIGIAPLLNFSIAWRFADRWSTLFDFDGLAGGPGRAIDMSIKLNYSLTERWSVGGGYRMLEGGVDTDDVYNFSWFNYIFLTVAYTF